MRQVFVLLKYKKNKHLLHLHTVRTTERVSRQIHWYPQKGNFTLPLCANSVLHKNTFATVVCQTINSSDFFFPLAQFVKTAEPADGALYFHEGRCLSKTCNFKSHNPHTCWNVCFPWMSTGYKATTRVIKECLSHTEHKAAFAVSFHPWNCHTVFHCSALQRVLMSRATLLIHMDSSGVAPWMLMQSLTQCWMYPGTDFPSFTSVPFNECFAWSLQRNQWPWKE